MDARQIKGKEIAATGLIVRRGNAWRVPSQADSGKAYIVKGSLDGKQVCSCPDHQTRGVRCKHMFAVEFANERQQHADGTETVTQTVTVKETIKKTYAQNWPAYNAAQTNEKAKFLVLLHDLCSGVEGPIKEGRGRKPIAYSDAIFSACYKVYSTFSGRRFMTDLSDAQRHGFIKAVPHFNSIFNTLESKELTAILKALIVKSSMPLKAVETDFAIDSSGFSACRFDRWFDEKHGKQCSKRSWVKVHLCCGVKTNVVTAVEIGDKDSGDSPYFQPLLAATKCSFDVKQVSGDKAYNNRANSDFADSIGVMPFLAFKTNATGGAGGMYKKMFHYFSYRQEEFLSHYHKRSNVESTFSMIKAKFRDSIRSKTETAMQNESLCKILCHNIVVLIHEMFALGIEPEFW